MRARDSTQRGSREYTRTLSRDGTRGGGRIFTVKEEQNNYSMSCFMTCELLAAPLMSSTDYSMWFWKEEQGNISSVRPCPSIDKWLVCRNVPNRQCHLLKYFYFSSLNQLKISTGLWKYSSNLPNISLMWYKFAFYKGNKNLCKMAHHYTTTMFFYYYMQRQAPLPLIRGEKQRPIFCLHSTLYICHSPRLPLPIMSGRWVNRSLQ